MDAVDGRLVVDEECREQAAGTLAAPRTPPDRAASSSSSPPVCPPASLPPPPLPPNTPPLQTSPPPPSRPSIAAVWETGAARLRLAHSSRLQTELVKLILTAFDFWSIPSPCVRRAQGSPELRRRDPTLRHQFG